MEKEGKNARKQRLIGVSKEREECIVYCMHSTTVLFEVIVPLYFHFM